MEETPERTDGPRIGITTGGSDAWAEAGSSYEPYAAVVRAVGGRPVRLAPGTGRPAARLLDELDGLLLSGGWDVHLRLYPRPPALGGRSPEELMELRLMRVETARDELEIPLVQAAVERDFPVLGICRGCQVLNVALGGALILDIPSEHSTEVVHTAAPPPGEESAAHGIRVLEDTLLAAALGDPPPPVSNSRHHQAVLPGTAEGVRVSAACAEDGIVEAIEVPGATWILGVQWHPERERDPSIGLRHRSLFAAFLRACERRG